MIESRFEYIFERDVLRWTEVRHGWQVTDDRYVLIAMHQFHSKEQGDVEIAVQKLRERANTFLEVIAEPTPLVFVRRWSPLDSATREGEVDFRAFLAAFKPNCVLLYLQPQDTGGAIVDGNYAACHNPPTDAIWTGDNTIYEQNFGVADQVSTALHGNPDLTSDVAACAR